MIRFLFIFLILTGMAQAQDKTAPDDEVTTKMLQEEINLDMCQSVDHNFDPASKECIYCAQGTTYDPAMQQCEGQLGWLGKCFGDDHYHAATKQCMYCAKGYEFSEEMRVCIPVTKKTGAL